MTTLFNPIPTPIFLSNGTTAAGAKAFFYTAGTSAPLTVYQDAGASVAHAFPVVASSAGVLPPIFLPYVSYRVQIVSANGTSIVDVDNVPNPAPPSSGGGGGITVDATQIFQTGDVKWRPFSGVVSGFVRLNGRTIGSAGSAATERANSDTSALYTLLWNEHVDAICPVSGGRGASAAADFAANKTLTLLSGRGKALVGADTMGNSGAGIGAVRTSCTATGSSATVTVSSASGLAVGMTVRVNNVAAGTITAISGTSVTLSVTPASGTGVDFIASPYENADTPGYSGGLITRTLTSAELPAHSHGINIVDPGHAHLYSITVTQAYSAGSLSAFLGVNNLASSATDTRTTGISATASSTGSGLPALVTSPGIVGTYYMKL